MCTHVKKPLRLNGFCCISRVPRIIRLLLTLPEVMDVQGVDSVNVLFVFYRRLPKWI